MPVLRRLRRLHHSNARDVLPTHTCKVVNMLLFKFFAWCSANKLAGSDGHKQVVEKCGPAQEKGRLSDYGVHSLYAQTSFDSACRMLSPFCSTPVKAFPLSLLQSKTCAKYDIVLSGLFSVFESCSSSPSPGQWIKFRLFFWGGI